MINRYMPPGSKRILVVIPNDYKVHLQEQAKKNHTNMSAYLRSIIRNSKGYKEWEKNELRRD